jgi:hypothetical protein
VRFAYADPPYLGLARLYPEHPDAGIYDTIEGHSSLIERLVGEFPDGWALSLHTPSLRHILPLCPDSVRVAAWVKPFASYKPGVNPAYAWEPVIFTGGRKRDRQAFTVRDWHAEVITLQRGLPGAKPESFAVWILDLLGAEPSDELVDLFPGSGAIGRAWDQWRSSPRLNLMPPVPECPTLLDGAA